MSLVDWLIELDERLERAVMTRPRGSAAVGLWAGILAMVGFCSLILSRTGPYEAVDLYFIPVLVACFFFRWQGLWITLPALVAYHTSSFWTAAPPLELSQHLLRDTMELLEWGVLAAFVLVTLDRYAEVKRYEARIRRDIALARTLQAALAPPDYDFGRLRIQGILRQSDQVGGDFYYFRPFQRKYVVICLGDVMGKGISASMVMAIVMGFMFEWGKRSASPSEVLDRLNRRLCRLWGRDAAWFTTLFYAVFDEETGVLTYSSGGHQGGVLVPARGALVPLAGNGLPVGIFEDTTWEERSVELRPGDRLVLFSDGVLEARAPDGSLFGTERLLEALADARNQSTPTLLHRVEETVLRHSQGQLKDDMALLVAEVKPEAPGVIE